MFGSTKIARPRLPAVEVYCVHGDAEFSSEEWRGRARSWLESYGIALEFGSYRAAHALFQWPQPERQDRRVSSHILVIAREKYLARIGSVEAYGGVVNEAGAKGFPLKRLSLPAGLHTELMGQSIVLSRLARKIRGVFRFRYRHKSPRVVQVQC